MDAPSSLRKEYGGLSGRIAGTDDGQSLVAFAGDSIVAKVHLPGTNFHALTLEGGDTLWAAASGALYRVAGDRAVEVPVPSLKPLLVAWVHMAVSAGQLWIAGPGGVARVPLATLHRVADGESLAIHPKIYGALDGISGGKTPPRVTHAIRVAADGRPWVITETGLAVADLSAERTNPMAPQVHIEDVAVGGVTQTLDDGRAIPPNPRRVAIRFASPMLGLAERGRVEYRLDPVDDGWNDGKPPRVAVYNQLRPGHYRFRVRAWNEDGVPSAGEASLSFRVLPAWYQAWWFFVLAVIAVASMSGGVVATVQRRRGQRSVRDAQARFDAVLAERTRMAGELHDTLLQAFTGVTLQLQALRSRMVSAPDEVERDLGRVLEVADGAMRDARSAVWDMRAPELQERDVAGALEAFAQEVVASHRMAGGAHVEIDVVVSGRRRRVAPSIEVAAQRVGCEAVANALRHADAKHIRLTIAFEPRQLCLEVRDDGIGFDVSRPIATEGRGHWGLVGMRDRARNAGGTLDVTSVPGSGTVIVLRLPVDST